MDTPAPPIQTGAPPASPGWHFDNSYARLPDLLYSRTAPLPVAAPRLLLLNEPLARELGLDPQALRHPDHAIVFAGNALPDGAEPIAQAYAGHQFGHFTLLGDGRAIVLGEHLAPDGRRVDVQLKGSGPTPYSRRGDGRAALGPMLREYLMGEAMHALGIPTTRALAVATTGETVLRERPLPGAVLTRVAASHIRVGTFEYIAALQDLQTLCLLVRYTLRRHAPDAADDPEPARRLLEFAIASQAALLAQWTLVGFIHGVMNTDNMALSGETIDYGPCAFMDAYDPDTVYSSIDRDGRYAFGQQPSIAVWNLARLAETLLPLLHDDRDQAIAIAHGLLDLFPNQCRAHVQDGLRAKLGLVGYEDGDDGLAADLLRWMQRTHADYANTFLALAGDAPADDARDNDPEFQAWQARWQTRVQRQPRPLSQTVEAMRMTNPWIIPRNHRVEEVLACAEHGDTAPLLRLLEALRNPFDRDPSHRDLQIPPPLARQRAHRTFCGT